MAWWGSCWGSARRGRWRRGRSLPSSSSRNSIQSTSRIFMLLNRICFVVVELTETLKRSGLPPSGPWSRRRRPRGTT
eukprot:8784236-Pyramimonas_sp.AAC.1